MEPDLGEHRKADSQNQLAVQSIAKTGQNPRREWTA
jgi:hypothetical protein